MPAKRRKRAQSSTKQKSRRLSRGRRRRGGRDNAKGIPPKPR